MPNGQKLKSSYATIDDDMFQLFKSVVSDQAKDYEKRYVSAIGKALAEELAAEKRLERLERYERKKRPWKFYGTPQRKFRVKARKGRHKWSCSALARQGIAELSIPSGPPFFYSRKTNDDYANDDLDYGAIIAADVLANDPQNPRAVRVFDAGGTNILTLKRKPASESEVLGEPVDVFLDPDRESKVGRFFYHLKEARTLMREIHFASDGPDSETTVGLFFNKLATTKKLLRSSTGRVAPSLFASLTDVRRLTRELVP